MQQIVDIINGPNFAPVSIVLLILVTVVILLSKSGVLQVHTKYVSMGIADKERNILRQQLLHAYQSCMGFLAKVPRFETFDEDRAKNICELIYDEMVNWIVLNHIEDTETYIGIRQESVWNIILCNILSLKYDNEDFKNQIYKNVERDIKMFVKIRKQYS